MNAISIKNIGPIEKLDIPLPPDGGVVVLRGANGAGKTTALEATQRVLGGNHQLSCRDGSERGTIDGLGVKITVGRSTRKTGDLEAIHLEGKLSIAELVDPGLKSPEAADAKRIKALVSLSDVDADERLFVQEIGEELYSVAVSNDKAGMDLLEMSARIKQDLQGYARRCEREAESHQGQAKAYKVAAGETFAVVENEADIKQRVVEATRKLTSLKETAAAGATLRAEADAAREYISIEESITPKQLDKLREDQKFAADAVVQAEKALAAAKDAERKALISLSHGERVAANVARYHKTIADAEGFAMPSLQEIFLAEMEAEDAGKIWDKAIAARKNQENLVLAKEHAAMAAKAEQQAQNARDAGRACDAVLEKAIRGGLLQVRDGRLYASTKRGKTLFCELSDGERWEIAIDMAAEIVGENGLIVVPQHAWEGLDATNRAFIAKHAKKKKVTIITAEAQREDESPELHAELMEAIA